MLYGQCDVVSARSDARTVTAWRQAKCTTVLERTHFNEWANNW